MNLLPDEQLRQSPVVANCRMNRKRQLVGINSYEQELGFDIGKYLVRRKLSGEGAVRWLDICCGEGNALIELANRLNRTNQSAGIHLTGIDLVGMFSAFDRQEFPFLDLVECAIEDWDTAEEYDLITCIHGIHYFGDKLGIVRRLGQLLKPDGLFLGNMDLNNVLDESGEPMGKWLRQSWKGMGWEYQARQRLLKIMGKSDWAEKWKYLGANDQAGPNYTGQEVVNSYYEVVD